MAASAEKSATGRWLLGGAALAFLLVPGHRSLPLAGIPIADVWFFAALLLLGLFFVAMPWRRVPLRRLWLQVAALVALCVLKAAVGLLGAGHGLTATYSTTVKPTSSTRRLHFRALDENGFAEVSCRRVDRELNFRQNGFHPLRQSLNLGFFNARPLFYIDREQAAAARLETVWVGWIHIPADGAYRFGADVEHGDQWRARLGDDAAAWADETSPMQTLRAGAHPIRVWWLRPPTAPLPQERLKDERPIRFLLKWQRDGGPIEAVPWWVLSTDQAGGASLAGGGVGVGGTSGRRGACWGGD